MGGASSWEFGFRCVDEYSNQGSRYFTVKRWECTLVEVEVRQKNLESGAKF